MATTDLRWDAQDTSPDAVEAAVRRLVVELHAQNESYVPARVLNLVCVVDERYSGEIANRLRHVGRYHASRTVVCGVTPGRETIDAKATVAASAEPKPGEFAPTRETVVLSLGSRHLAHIETVVDALVVTDLPTLVWAPHGHAEAVRRLLGIAQIVLLDSVDEPDPAEALARAKALCEDVYVVDLAWLRSTPWRERLAAAFDPEFILPDLRRISAFTVRHHPASQAAAVLLVGWLASRLGWELSPLTRRGAALCGSVSGGEEEAIQIRLEVAPELQVRGLAGVTVETSTGRWLRYDRGTGGLRATYRNARGDERTWTVMGASRGEAGILGEGIRQALLRDPTYGPALNAAVTLLPVED